jgi:glycosyltransferase involved in cell wall biosynthesis
MPEFDRESGSRRAYHLIEVLLDAGWQVTYACRELRDGERYARLLRRQGIATYVGFGEQFRDLLNADQFDLAVVAFWHVAEEVLPIIRQESPTTRVLVDSIDLHFLRNSRQTFLGSDGRVPRSLGSSFATELVRELNVYAAADGVLTVSPKEAGLIQDFLGDQDLAHAVPDREDMAVSPIPFAERKGILFVGNFRHAPNVGAMQFLCREVVPLLDPKLLAEQPVYIVGNDPTDTVLATARRVSQVRMVGWVPSVTPYLHSARVSVVPIQYGAGTKRKLLQSLLAGTPAVSTTVGVEGLHLQDGEHVVVADEPSHFAAAITRLVTDETFWSRLASAGQTHLSVRHGRAAVRAQLLEAVRHVLNKEPKLAPPSVVKVTPPETYSALIDRIRGVVNSTVPDAATVLVVSRGDDALLDLGGRRGCHFPQADSRAYAGHHPADSAAAEAHLEGLRRGGAEYLLFPQTAFWWLDHYADFRTHLDKEYERVWADDDCIIYKLSSTEPVTRSTGSVDVGVIERLRPTVPDILPLSESNGTHAGKRILALGIYLANQPNTVEDVVANLAATSVHEVTQKWIALMGQPPSEHVARVTVRTETRKVPKFELLNQLLSQENLADFDYVLLFDDDIVLAERFLDRFISLQDEFDFLLAQPARTSNSYIDHPIVEQQRGCVARQTRFVEIGPVVSFHKSLFELVFPFDLTSPMGWGYENVWSYQLAQRRLKMGIIDAVPVDHSMRQPVANYKWSEADRQRKAYLKNHSHYALDDCFRVLEAIPLRGVEAVV